MKSCILLSHVFIKPGEDYKKDVINFTLTHFRKNNPNSYIILTGHGEKLLPLSYDLCDYIVWDSQIKENEIGVGHPYYVSKGLLHAKEKGFTHVFKNRADGINLIANIESFCHKIITDENKKLLITQQTSISKQWMGDLLMYGELDFLIKCWDYNNWHPSPTGLVTLATNFLKTTNCSDYPSALSNYASFRDIFTLKWIDLGCHWPELASLTEELLENTLYPFNKFLWGSLNNWALFDENGIFQSNKFECEKTWYNQ